MSNNIIHTIRYMGIKSKLLDRIIPAIKKVTPENGIVCDIMGGSNTVGYALKPYFKIITNDVQNYSYIISKAIIENQTTIISNKLALKDLYENFLKNEKQKSYSFFYDNYSDTYFSPEQCLEIDSIRYAIDQLNDDNKKNLYLSALMGAMCIAQSTPGHFAQFMPKDHKRIISLRKICVWQTFLKKCDDYSNIVFTKFENRAFCSDFNNLINQDLINYVDTIYLDSPYSGEQYSRFYHILETITRYDNPSLSFKAKYRDDRFMSKFCYKSKVATEFETIFKYCNKNKINIVISYSNKGVLPINNLIEIVKIYFKKVNVEEITYSHSTQGKGNKQLLEYIITGIS